MNGIPISTVYSSQVSVQSPVNMDVGRLSTQNGSPAAGLMLQPADSASGLDVHASIEDWLARAGFRDVESWSCEEVAEWLQQECNFSEPTVEVFSAKHVDGMALRGLLRMSADSRFLHEVLHLELGLDLLGQRLRLIEQLHRLFFGALEARLGS